MQYRPYLKIKRELSNVQARIDEGDPDPALPPDRDCLAAELEKHPDHLRLAASMRGSR